MAIVNSVTAGIGDSTQSISSRPVEELNLGSDAFFTLLITEMKHQDPLDPKEDRDFLAQLAQFSALQEMRALTESTSELQAFQAVTQSAALLGRTVEALVPGPVTGVHEPISGVVTDVLLGELPPTIVVNGIEVDLDKVTRIY